MTKQALISVVMPAYNHEKFVGEAIDSVLNQSWQNLELIIIDDGSSDQTGAIAKSYDDARLRYSYQENQDAYNALNNGMAKAQGDFIAIINSDDAYSKNRLSRLIEFLQQNNAECVFSAVTLVDDHSQVLEDPDLGWNQWHQSKLSFYRQSPDDLYRGFLHSNLMVTTSNLLMTAKAYHKVGEFTNLRYLHDYDYIFRMLRAFPDGVKFLDSEKLVNYRLHGSNTISEAAIVGREQDQDIIRKAVLAICPQTSHEQLNTGINRLIELDQELSEVRKSMQETGDAKSQKISLLENTSTKVLLTTILGRLRNKLFI